MAAMATTTLLSACCSLRFLKVSRTALPEDARPCPFAPPISRATWRTLAPCSVGAPVMVWQVRSSWRLAGGWDWRQVEFFQKISFGGISNSHNLLFLQIFLKRPAKPSAGNTSAGFPWVKWPQILLNLHQASQTFSGIFSGTLLNLTWLCSKASRNLLWTFFGTFSKPPKPSPESSPAPCWTWPGSAAKPPGTFSEPSLEPSPEACWTWPGSSPQTSRLSPEPSPEPCWIWPGSAPKPPGTFTGTFFGTLLNLTWLCTKARTFSETLLSLTWLCTKASWNLLQNLLLNLTWLCTKASQTFTATFPGTLLNLTWLCPQASRNLLRNPVEPDLALRQSLPNLLLLGNLLQNPVELDLALHQGFLEPSSEPSPEPCWTWPGSAPTVHLLRNLLRNPVEPDLALHQPWTFSGIFSGTLLNVTWPCTKASHTFSRTFGTFSGTSLNLIWRLHQCTPELFWGEDPISLRCRGKTRSRINHTKQWWFQWMHRWAERIRNHSDPDHLPLLCKAMLFAAGIFFFGLGGVAAKELHESFSVQAALIAAALMAAVAGGLVPVTKSKSGWRAKVWRFLHAVVNRIIRWLAASRSDVSLSF